MNPGRIIIITGGIGSGKSVVSRILREKGVFVYDCDYRARQIMDSSGEIREAIRSYLGDDCVSDDGRLCRPRIAEHVFSDAEKRRWLNSLVHGRVRDDILAEAARIGDILVETAIPASSGLTEMADSIWLVTCPGEERLRRITARDGVDAGTAIRRIEAQRSEYDSLPSRLTREIVNDGCTPLLPQIDIILEETSGGISQ